MVDCIDGGGKACNTFAPEQQFAICDTSTQALCKPNPANPPKCNFCSATTVLNGKYCMYVYEDVAYNAPDRRCDKSGGPATVICGKVKSGRCDWDTVNKCECDADGGPDGLDCEFIGCIGAGTPGA
jgi:hypothetical protein